MPGRLSPWQSRPGPRSRPVLRCVPRRRFLDSAQQNLADRAYDLARRDALQAKNKALEALAEAEKDAPE